MRNLTTALSIGLMLAGLYGCEGGGGGGGRTESVIASVNFSQTTQPREPLPDRYMRIAVYNADVTAEAGSDSVDEKKWREMAADFVQSELQRAAEEHSVPIKLVDREHMKATLGEKDMAAAGVTEGGDAMSSAAISGADAVLTSKITIKVDKQGKTEYKEGHSLGGMRFGGGEQTTESRNITVTCQFQLKDAANNEIIYGYTGRPRQHHEGGASENSFFKKSKAEVDMAPRDEVIAQILESELDVFMSKFVPVTFSDSTTVEPSRNENSRAGARALVAEDWQTALTNFKAALAEDPEDHESLYGAGVAHEKLGQYEEARKNYKLAMSYEEKEPKYAAALTRVETQISRTEG
ncbi:MAG TPA: tetratricopeptide repeat protein [Phycisphaerae bacterium]|nr:tetratricopeptide repeat protein [Phycisphaerae bacterium]